jgi:hypothetical protein
MRRFTYLLLFAAFTAALVGLAAPQPKHLDPRSELLAALRAKKKVVLVSAADPASTLNGYRNDPEHTADETYGDWKNYFDDFGERYGRDFKIILVSSRAHFSQIVEEPKIKTDWATLFILDAEHGLLYDDILLDPEEYKIGVAYLRQEPGSKSMAADKFFQPVRIRLR